MEAKLAFLGHALMENRSGLIVNPCLTPADGQAERTAALDMIKPLANRPSGVTLGADKGYDARVFVNELRSMNVRPHVAQNNNGRRLAIDRRTTRHPGYPVSQRIRKRIEEAFCWMKTVAGERKTKFRGVDWVAWSFAFAAAAYNLIRLPKLIGENPRSDAKSSRAATSRLRRRRSGDRRRARITPETIKSTKAKRFSAAC